MATSDVTIAQDGQGNIKLHPYLVTLVRWCMSCLWSTATVILHRLLTTPLQPITGPKLSQKAKLPKRVAGTEHLDPEPKVECQVLHEPRQHTHDVIFVHGLYGSLGNTWRQGDWRPKYRAEPKKIKLRDHSTKKQCNCQNTSQKNQDTEDLFNELNENLCKIDEKLLNKIIPNRNDLITEKFYNNTLINQVEIIDYETQADFVRKLFKKECEHEYGNMNKYNNANNEMNKDNYYDNNNGKQNNEYNDLNKTNDFYEETVKECLNKYNNFNIYDTENSIKTDSYFEQKQYENMNMFSKHKLNKCNNYCSENTNNYYADSKCSKNYYECICKDRKCDIGCGCNCDECYSTCWPRDWIREDYPGARVISINYTSDPYLWRPLWIKENKRLSLHERAGQMMEQLLALGVGTKPIVWVGHSKGGLFIKQLYCDAYEAYKLLNKSEQKDNSNKENNNLNINDNVLKNCNENSVNLNMNEDDSNLELEEEITENISEDISSIKARASIWEQSKGFMFYSVPHRGSPLADIKTPVTARSVELLEISKDCDLVLDLHSRWLSACSSCRPAVRGFVETCRTLMSVLWLRIVSVDSADAGVGILHGVSVDHREICKPSSRQCLLYTELMDLIREALSDCSC